jgi:hypothetical protein
MKRIRLQDIQEAFRRRAYTLLSTTYLNSNSKLDYKCPEGHQGSISWDSFKQGHGCAECLGNKKHTIEEIGEVFKKEGWTLLATEYKNARTNNLYYLCSKGHKGSISWNSFQHGNRCLECSGKKPLTLEYVRAFFQKEGYTLLSQKYEGVHKRLDYLCPQNHRHHITFSMFRWGQRCPRCHKDTRRHTFEYIQNYFKQQGYTLLSTTYENTKSPLEYECPKGHKNITCWNTFQQGRRCPDCHNFYSVAEQQIADVYKHLNPLTRDREVIHPYELDIYFPMKKIAVEHNGLYWHSDCQERMTPSYHRKKMKLCMEQGIRLLTMFEDEWWYQKDICISRMNDALGIIQNRIFARKCEIKQISNKEAYGFLTRTHLQGPGVCEVAFGLFYNDKLVQVMTFGSPNRAHTSKGKKVLEMKRLAGELNTIIVGGASKLFKLGLQYARDNSYEIIKSYCDLRWGTGNLYKQLGFTKTSDGKPSYYYTNGTKRWRGQSLAQNKKKTGTSEKEKVARLGLWKIYDCGHQTWEYKI